MGPLSPFPQAERIEPGRRCASLVAEAAPGCGGLAPALRLHRLGELRKGHIVFLCREW